MAQKEQKSFFDNLAKQKGQQKNEPVGDFQLISVMESLEIAL